MMMRKGKATAYVHPTVESGRVGILSAWVIKRTLCCTLQTIVIYQVVCIGKDGVRERLT